MAYGMVYFVNLSPFLQYLRSYRQYVLGYLFVMMLTNKCRFELKNLVNEEKRIEGEVRLLKSVDARKLRTLKAKCSEAYEVGSGIYYATMIYYAQCPLEVD